MGRRRGGGRDELRAAQADRFAAELAALLQDLGLTHRELAQQLGITHHTVDSWTRVADPMLPGEANLQRLVALLEQRQPGLGRRLAQITGRNGAPPAPPTAALAPIAV